MKNKYDIVIGIPTLNEEVQISRVVKTIDAGIQKYLPGYRCLILNINDSFTSDNTVVNFNNTPTVTQKESKLGGEGKGSNILKLLDFAVRRKIEGVCMIDADIQTIKPMWVKRLLFPIMNNKADYVCPIYSRNRYEGSTTNHFCVPILEKVFNYSPQQPIGGDFAFNYKFAQAVSKERLPFWANQYGIDIFLTFLALSQKKRIIEVYLGRKIHSPSFPKMIPMFSQVASTLIWLIPNSHNNHAGRSHSKTGGKTNKIDNL